MSHEPNTQPPPVASADDTVHKPFGSRLRPLALIVLLCIMLAGLYYDRKVARPGSQQAYDLTMELAEKNAELSAEDQPVTNETVQAALKRRPGKLVETDDYAIETYRWRRGLLFLTYISRIQNFAIRKIKSSELDLCWNKHLVNWETYV